MLFLQIDNFPVYMHTDCKTMKKTNMNLATDQTVWIDSDFTDESWTKHICSKDIYRCGVHM